MFRVDKIDNGFLLTSYVDMNERTDFFKNEKKLVNGIRASLGMKPIGRVKQVVAEVVDTPFDK